MNGASVLSSEESAVRSHFSARVREGQSLIFLLKINQSDTTSKHAVALLLKALCYKPKGRGFESQ
jgi:hypothetical protein